MLATKGLNFFQLKNSDGFTLLEIILVTVLLGIAAIMVVPFVGHIFSNLLEGRELSHRESQAAMALERFVRDVRGADRVVIDNDQKMTLTVDGTDVIYDIVSGNLRLDNQVLAKHLDDSLSIFDNDLDEILGYPFITLTLVVQMSGGGTFKLSASAVPRFAIGGGGEEEEEEEEDKGKGKGKGKE